MRMRIGLAQIHTHTAHFEYNYSKIKDCIIRASEKNCDLVVFPELCLFGYWPSDLLERKELVLEQLKYINKIKKIIPKNTAVLIGAVTLNPSKSGKYYKNSAIFLEKNKKEKLFHKELLPNYDVFDETRHFEKGNLKDNIVKFKGETILVTICEDIWGWGSAWKGTRYPENPLLKLKKEKPSLVVNLSASPFSKGKTQKRRDVVVKTAKYFKAPVVYVNQVTSQDEIIFDGGSFAVNKTGKRLAQNIYFEEDLNVLDLNIKKGGVRSEISSETESLRKALVLGIRDFVEKNNFKKIHLGLSGGIDSALVAALACDAVGPSRVTAIALPGPYSSQESFDLALKLTQNLKCEFINADINAMYRTCSEEFETSFGMREFGIAHENLQSRLRGTTLMAYSNFKNSLLLATGNKDEFSVGYSTLYGDMCGGLAPIGDLLKGEVYELSNLYNSEREIIPKEIINRAPTAELKENQKDQDTLPAYEQLDKIVDKLVVRCEPPKTKIEKEIFAKIKNAEFKRWQTPPILRVSEHSYGTGRRYPITWFLKT